MPTPTPSSAPSSGLLAKLTANAKQAVGRLVGNDHLVEEGALQERQVEATAEAARLEAEAEQAERSAELSAEQAQNQVEQARVQVGLAEQARAHRIERDEREAKEAAARLEARQQGAVAAQEEAGEAALDRAQMTVAVEKVKGAQEATEIEAEADRAEQAADALDAARTNLDQTGAGR